MECQQRKGYWAWTIMTLAYARHIFLQSLTSRMFAVEDCRYDACSTSRCHGGGPNALARNMTTLKLAALHSNFVVPETHD
jgi:hypothetical protein